MRKLAAALLLCVSASLAQTSETIFFRAMLSPANEVPSVNIQASGTVTLQAHVVRDASGTIMSGSVDFIGSCQFPGQVTLTGMHVHPGAADINGPAAISSGLDAGANSLATDSGGRGQLNLQGQVPPSNQLALDTLRGMVANPSGYYANIHTTDNPAGAMRGQLQRADLAVYMGLMLPDNEVPPTSIDASGVSHVEVLTTRDASGALTSGQMIFDINYNFPGQQTFTGFHIHNGPAGVNAGVIFSSGIGGGPQSVQSDPSGIGNLRRSLEVNMNDPTQVSNLQGLLDDSRNYYINIHTTDFPGGAIRAQLRRTELMTFQTPMLTSNEVPPITGLNATAPAVVQVRTVRWEDGSVRAGVVTFDVNYRFPDAATFTGLHIHDGAVGISGPVRISSGLSGGDTVASAGGFGNIYRTVTVSDTLGLATLNSLVANPENHYINLHTTVNPTGVVRCPLAPVNTAPPVVDAVISGNLDRTNTSTAPNGRISILGRNLAKVGTNLDGWEGRAIPESLNGAVVAIGGQRARLLLVSPSEIVAVAPLETAMGPQQVSVHNGNAPSAPLAVNVAAVAPAVYSYLATGTLFAFRLADYSFVSPDNPARAGDTLLFYLTGLGQTTPALTTGMVVPFSPSFNTVPVTVTIGGQSAEVVSSMASPDAVGLYEVRVRVPSGLAAGNAALVVKAGGATANSVNLPIARP